jgi:polyferredoxin
MNTHPSGLPSDESFHLTRIRYGMQAFVTLGILVIGIRHLLPGKIAHAGSFDAFCPFGAIESLWVYLKTGETLLTTNLLNFSILLGVLGVSFIAGRAFCGWMCPLGAIQDLLAGLTNKLARSSRRKHSNSILTSLPIHRFPKVDGWLRKLKYLVLAIVLIASVRAVYPPLHDICPVRATFGLQLSTPLLWSVLVTFGITSMLQRRFWCKYLCPLGGGLAIFNRLSSLRIFVDRERCIACSRCEADCPMDIPNISNNTRDTECIRCLTCLETCSQPEAMTLRLG